MKTMVNFFVCRLPLVCPKFRLQILNFLKCEHAESAQSWMSGKI